MSDFFKTLVFVVIIFGTVVYLIEQMPQLSKGDFGLFRNMFNPFAGEVKDTAENKSGQSSSEIPDDQIPSGFKRSDLSPYFGKGKIDFDKTNSIMSISFKFEKNTDVTGWRIKTNKGETVLPLVMAGYDVVGSSNLNSLIISREGMVRIYPGMSATGRNFRLNKCAGFLNDSYSFVPAIPEDNCPEIDRGAYAGLSGECQNYILSLGRCRLPARDFINSLSADAQGITCRRFLEDINYLSCANDHFRDNDFYRNEWWIWNNQNIFDPEHDWIRLFDRNELLVDSYIY